MSSAWTSPTGSYKNGPARQSTCLLVELAYFVISVYSLLGLATTCPGQHTETRDAGGGRKIEFVYDAAGRAVETRSMDLTGRLQGKVEHEYLAGFLVPQETSSSYWPDGKTVKSVAHVLYDENANFTSELVEVFNEAGAQTGGTKLTHDPFTGIDRCSTWDPPSHAYQASHCPASEESAAAPSMPKRLTRDQAMKQLERARQARREEQNAQRTEGKSPTPASTTEVKEFGIIVPAQLRPGERVSASVVDDAQKYDEVQGIRVLRLKLPTELQGQTTALADWSLEAPGESPQRADGPATFTVPRTSELTFTLRQVENPSQSVSLDVTVAKNSPQKSSRPQTFEAPALCLKGDLCTIRGPFDGDSTKTLGAFGGRLAPIVAESEDALYLRVPDTLPTGATHLIVADGSQVTVLPVDVAELRFTPARRELHKGETLLIHAVLSGPEELAENLWQAGVFPAAVSAEKAREAIPGFETRKQGTEGVILVIIRNTTPEAVSFRGSKDQKFVFELTPDSFTNGEFKYHFVVEAAKPARFAIKGTALPFLAPVQGQPF